MKNLKILFSLIAILCCLLFISCTNDNEEMIKQEEISDIITYKKTLLEQATLTDKELNEKYGQNKSTYCEGCSISGLICGSVVKAGDTYYFDFVGGAVEWVEVNYSFASMICSNIDSPQEFREFLKEQKQFDVENELLELHKVELNQKMSRDEFDMLPKTIEELESQSRSSIACSYDFGTHTRSVQVYNGCYRSISTYHVSGNVYFGECLTSTWQITLECLALRMIQ